MGSLDHIIIIIIMYYGLWCKLPFMKLIDFRHIAKKNVLLVLQGVGDKVSHGRVVHLGRISLQLEYK